MELEQNTGVYVISVAAKLTGLHPQTLRQYDKLGLVSPVREGRHIRLYSSNDIQRLLLITQLSQEGLNLAGIERVLALQEQVIALRSRLAQLEKIHRETALVLSARRPR